MDAHKYLSQCEFDWSCHVGVCSYIKTTIFPEGQKVNGALNYVFK